MFSARLDKQDKDDQVLDEIELYINLNLIGKLTESDIDSFDVRSQLQQQIQKLETKRGGWWFDKNNSKTISFYKTTELNGLT